MDFDFGKLIPLIIFVLWAIFAGKRRKKPAKRQPGPSKEKPKRPTNPLLGKLQNSLENFFEQMEQAKIETSPQKPQSPPDSTSEPDSDELYDEYEETADSTATEDTTRGDSKILLRTQSDPSRQKKLSRKRVEQLKKAIIWSEILAKPVGLKED